MALSPLKPTSTRSISARVKGSVDARDEEDKNGNNEASNVDQNSDGATDEDEDEGDSEDESDDEYAAGNGDRNPKLVGAQHGADYKIHGKRGTAKLELLRRLLDWAPNSLGICQWCAKYKPRAEEYWLSQKPFQTALDSLSHFLKAVDQQVNTYSQERDVKLDASYSPDLLPRVYGTYGDADYNSAICSANGRLCRIAGMLKKEMFLGDHGGAYLGVRGGVAFSWSWRSRGFETVDCFIDRPQGYWWFCRRYARGGAKELIVTVQKTPNRCPGCVIDLADEIAPTRTRHGILERLSTLKKLKAQTQETLEDLDWYMEDNDLGDADYEADA